jgi:hypothetical protein
MTENKECSICFNPFIFPTDIDNGIEIFNKEIIDKSDNYIINNLVFSKKEKRYIIRKNLKHFYNRYWYPNFKQYKCSTENCNTTICGNCIQEIQIRSYNFIFRCTHCRLYDWKEYMRKHVFSELIMICLIRLDTNPLFSLRDYCKAGFL